MVIQIDDTDPRPIYQQIVDEVRRAVVTGSARPDDALPSVRQLAADLKVNPNTVQQAYRELEREGLVYGRRGQGTFVAELPVRAASRERDVLALSVAQRALRDAHRNGLSVDELLDAVQRVANDDAGRKISRGGGA